MKELHYTVEEIISVTFTTHFVSLISIKARKEERQQKMNKLLSKMTYCINDHLFQKQTINVLPRKQPPAVI